jgi:hypothetical protein
MSPEFLTPLDARRFPGTRKRQLLARLVFQDEDGNLHEVPEGFIYNGVSFPLVWGGAGEASSALHDHAYTRTDLYTRSQADDLLCQALKAENMNAIRRAGWWAMVRAFGGLHYGKEELDESDLPVDPHAGA